MLKVRWKLLVFCSVREYDRELSLFTSNDYCLMSRYPGRGNRYGRYELSSAVCQSSMFGFNRRESSGLCIPTAIETTTGLACVCRISVSRKITHTNLFAIGLWVGC